MRPKGTAAELERRRRQAVGLWKQGMSQVAVAEALGTSEASVSRWKGAWQEGGPEALAAKPHPGKPPRLTAAQRRRLGELLREGPRQHGYGTELWTLARVAELIRRRFGVRYHPGHVWYLLRERDELAIQRWRQHEWPRIKKRPKDRPQHRLLG
jgi:transposase